jgi:hypothetical protein
MAFNTPPLAFAFNPITVEINGEGANEYARITATGITLYREPRNGKITFSLQAIAQSLFDAKQLYNIQIAPQPDNTLIKDLEIEFNGEDNSGEYISEKRTIPIIWGAMQPGETWTQTKTITWFKNFPFTVPLYLDTAKTVMIRHDKKNYYTKYMELEPGKYNLPVDVDANEKVVFRIDEGDEGGIFDYTFDYTFRAIPKSTILITLLVNECTEGTYLRWINKFGEYCYYLFSQGATSNEVKNASVDLEEYSTTVDYAGGYHPGTNHPQAKEIQQTAKLFAPLVDKSTRTFLQSLPESPVVHLFKGYDDENREQWIAVNIAPATFNHDTAPLQDFECTLILPKTFTQSL